jgi:UDP-glucuronate decarboxylase
MPRDRTVIIAGGGGFLGSHLCDTMLARGHRVICIDNFLTGARSNIAHLLPDPRFILIEHDICRPLAVHEPVHQIYNLACPASPARYRIDPLHTLRTCIVGTLNLLELARTLGASFLQASTSEIYGDPEQHPQSENYLGHVDCTGPRACYVEGKRAAETACFDMLRSGQVDVRVARIFNTYGPRMRPDDGRVVSNFIIRALRGQKIDIHGDGTQTRSFCYVSDLVAGLIALMETPTNPAMPVNLGNPAEYTVNDLAHLIIRMTKGQPSFIYLPLPEGDPRRRRPDTSRAERMLGWRPEVSLDDGLTRTITHFRQWLKVAVAPNEARADREIGNEYGLVGAAQPACSDA